MRTTPTSTHDPSRLGLARGRRRVVAIVVGVLLAAALGGIAAFVADERPVLRGVVIGVSLLAPAVVLALVVLGPGDDARWPHPEDVVELRWSERACSGAFVDLICASVAVMVVTAVTGLRPDAGVVLTVLVVLALGDATVRYRRIGRAEVA